ncbi:MAG: TRAP transporter substrate-binding protein [Acidobacteriia bacterium]|nr:TRAP transporter substrate-binding protein [Methyloceanibacter sp.]MBX5471411.1 TRAP transporter substrate-binding protein [Acetobacteraceae bacterium]MCL6491571.1 TRAP transporter substrate-binding protein [Terriglobia bacterium]
MTPLTRRRAIPLTLGTALALPGILKYSRAHAAEFALKYANNLPQTHPMSVRMMAAAEAIRAETGGKVDVKVFPNNQLGGDTDMLNQLRMGAIDFFTLSPLILSTLVPKVAISGIGFAWSGYDKVWPALDGELGASMRAEIQKAGLYAFPKIFDNGFRQITTSTKPIRDPNDLVGLKIRVPPGQLWTSMFKAFGSSPMTINFAEVYTALQTKIADAQENPLAVIDTAKLYEVQKYLSKTNHMWDGFWLLASGKIWPKLPADVKAVLQKHFTEAALRERDDVFKLNATLEQGLKAKGMMFNDVDTHLFQAKLQSAGFYTEWKAKFGADLWKLLEKSSGASL